MALRGDTSGKVMKTVKIENGAEISVPDFVRKATSSGSKRAEYVERLMAEAEYVSSLQHRAFSPVWAKAISSRSSARRCSWPSTGIYELLAGTSLSVGSLPHRRPEPGHSGWAECRPHARHPHRALCARRRHAG